MDVLAKAQPVMDTFREQLPNLKEAFDKILGAFRDVWAKVTDTGLLNSFVSRITEFLSGAVSSAQSSIESAGGSASGAQSQDQSQLAAGEAAPLLSSVVEHASTLADSVAPPPKV